MRLRLAVATVLLNLYPLAAADPFEFKASDRVVLLGGTLIEREQKYGYWELALSLKNSGKSVIFRNLGWSGDTVHADARGRFEYADKAKCFNELVSLTREIKPTVIVICYGQNESFEGESGVLGFTAGLDKLIDALSSTNARLILLSPTPLEKAPGLPDPVTRNKVLSRYVDATKGVADRHGIEFVDLFKMWTSRPSPAVSDGGRTYTENGIHLTPEGYKYSAELLFGRQSSRDQDSLRSKIIDKNRLFFYRWRPQNETYLFGFRKHEQGKNAAEVAQFDPLIDAAEKDINSLLKSTK